MSRMPSTSTGTVRLIPIASAARSTSMRSGLGSGGSTSGSLANSASGTGSRGSSTSRPTRPTSSSSSRCSTTSRRSSTGSVTTACASSPSTSSAKSRSDAPSLTRRRTPGARVAQVGDQRGNQPTTRGADHAEARVARVEPLQQREVGAHRLELAVDPTRAVEHERRRTPWARPPCGCARAAARRAPPRAGAPGRTRSTARSRARRRRP